MPQPPQGKGAEVLAEVRRYCHKLTSAHMEDQENRQPLEAAAACLGAAYGLVCQVTCGVLESQARLERAQRHHQEHAVPLPEQLVELAGQLDHEFTALAGTDLDAPQTRASLDAGADSLRAVLGFLSSVVGDPSVMTPRLGVDLGSEYLRRAARAYREQRAAGASGDPIGEQLRRALDISEDLTAAPR